MLTRILPTAMAAVVLLASSAFGAMDAAKAEAVVNDYLQAASHPKKYELTFPEGDPTMEQLERELHQTHVKENADRAVFMADGYFKTDAISANKLPKEEYFVNDNVGEDTVQKIVGSTCEQDSCLVQVEIVNHEGKWKIRNGYKVVAEGATYRIYPSTLTVDTEGDRKFWINAYHQHEELPY